MMQTILAQQVTPINTIILALAIMGVFFTFFSPIVIYSMLTSDGVRRLIYRMRRQTSCLAIIIDQDRNPEIRRARTHIEGKMEVFTTGKEMYAYSPIANGLGIVEIGNSIPYTLGVTIDANAVDKALDAGIESGEIDATDEDPDKHIPVPKKNTKTMAKNAKSPEVVTGGYTEFREQKDQLKQGLMSPKTAQDDTNTEIVYRWVTKQMPTALHNCIIRPLAKFSSQEFYNAIEAKIVNDLLSLSLTKLDILLLVITIGVIFVSVYFGYTNQQNVATLQTTINTMQHTINQLVNQTQRTIINVP